ncbi:GDP-L-fucose synthase [Myxococcota bacterium]|nr:GDP-L-fucose synthase [Myxococcota bacterium]
MGFWDGRRVLLTGAGGFLGSHLADRLRAAGAILIAPRRAELDLLDRAATEAAFRDARPELVLHAAVDGGGIGYMREHPGSVLFNNLLMNTHALHAAYLAGAERFVGVSSVCAYPRDAPVPMREADLWAGYPEPTNGPYGLSKRVLMEQGRAYRAQYGLRVAFPMPTNLYGPRDDFSLERSHVVPALIRRCSEAVEAGAEEIVVWGTGKATRELLYVEDCADAVLTMAERWDSPEPVNLGNGVEVPVAELVAAIARACGFSGRLVWDTTKPDGQPRKSLDTSRAAEGFGWRASVDLDEGLRRTVAWYRSSR